MNSLTPEGEAFIADIANRHGVSEATAMELLVAVKQGGGTMAQFQTREFGSGQWMRGGMTMVGDMFNHSMKAKVDSLCSELSAALADGGDFFKSSAPEGEGGGNGMKMNSGGNWWPAELGAPSSTGSQNHVRYAVFPGTRRLAIERGGKLTIHDTSDHVISGVSQQQGGESSLTFSSQHGTIAVASLPVVSGPGAKEAAAENRNFAAEPKAQSEAGKAVYDLEETGPPPPLPDALALLEKLGALRDGGVITPEEFAEKKKALLARI